jgi:large subunit ribosomal protein L29
MSAKIRKYTDGLREKDAGALKEDLIKLRREQFSLRMQSASGQTVKPSDFGKSKRNIARVKTVMRQKALSATKVAGAKK